MKNKNLITGFVGLLILVGIAYGANLYNHKYGDSTGNDKIDSDTSLGVDFVRPEGWKITEYSDALSWESPDLRFRCEGGVLYSSDEAKANWSIPGDDTMPGPCFRAPIGRGSQLSVTKRARDVHETLDSIASFYIDEFGISPQKIKVDGYNAISWQGKYGDSPASNATVELIRGGYVYSVTQSWGYDKPNPYPDLMDQVVNSFKFTD